MPPFARYAQRVLIDSSSDSRVHGGIGRPIQAERRFDTSARVGRSGYFFYLAGMGRGKGVRPPRRAAPVFSGIARAPGTETRCCRCRGGLVAAIRRGAGLKGFSYAPGFRGCLWASHALNIGGPGARKRVLVIFGRAARRAKMGSRGALGDFFVRVSHAKPVTAGSDCVTG